MVLTVVDILTDKPISVTLPCSDMVVKNHSYNLLAATAAARDGVWKSGAILSSPAPLVGNEQSGIENQ